MSPPNALTPMLSPPTPTTVTSIQPGHKKVSTGVGNQSSLRVQHRATTHPITPARTQRPTHEGSIRPRAYPICPGLSLSFTDPCVRPCTARSAHALVRPHAKQRIRAKWRSHTRNGATDCTSTADGPKMTDPQAHKDAKWHIWTPENPPTGPKAHKDAKWSRKDPVPSPRAMSMPNGPH
ncbi:hypothetical protein PAXINDRAFT_16404 [Paxillus involutus ATCC 200175]|uniref:Uncharacterized protein n=1 Tax=Paxillus involutus ATCC 200175 TaxID=664439 RepID=A0A0C9TIV5_PAXIN|nr:hypothetical protein PAXINDRAFT_16404 [Paxillus involutus ATCC 200175]